jgi:hypothetical protein
MLNTQNNRSTYRYDYRFANSRQPQSNQFEYRSDNKPHFLEKGQKKTMFKAKPSRKSWALFTQIKLSVSKFPLTLEI